MAKTYPTSVSRTLDPTGKSLVTIVGQHDRELSDADVNLIQDLQDSKRQRLLNDQVTSGALTYNSFQFNPFIENVFFIPQFDVLFNGEVVTVTGSQSPDQTLNRVVVPPPAFWTTGVQDEPARIYVVFLEMWYQILDPDTSQGYFVDPTTGLRYFFPFGGVNPDPSNAESLPDDSIDPFQGLETTIRAQIQWRLNVQRVALTYDFTKFQFGLDPGTTTAETVYAQASRPAPIQIPSMTFTNMGKINGDTAVWRAGDGNVNNSLGTMDGYSYAMPVAVVFQRNSGPFDLTNNPFGCADPANSQSGLLQFRVSGRFDSLLADQIFPDQVVDTRSSISIDGYDFDKLMREGFVDVITGSMRQAISRGRSPGDDPRALGSTLQYFVSMAPSPVANTDTVGQWDGFANGFSSDQRIFSTTQAISVNQKTIGIVGSPWTLNDAFSISLPQSSQAVIQNVNIQALVNNTQAGTKTPTNLLPGQITINGLGSKTVTVVLSQNLQGTPFDPGSNNIFVTLQVEYPASTGTDLRQIPYVVDGGYLQDVVAGIQLPLYGISEYALQTQQTALEAYQVWAVNPKYSNTVFGLRIWIQIPGSQGVQQTISGVPVTVFTIPRQGLNNNISGWYAVRAWDLVSNNSYNISSRVITSSGAPNCVITLQGSIDPNSTVVFSFLGQDTAQLAYNAPVKGATQIEETVLLGNAAGNSQFHMDSRVSVASVAFDSISSTNTVVLAASNCIIKGISGDDVNQLIFVQDNSGNFTAVTVSSVSFSGGTVTVVLPATVNLLTQQFFFVGSILPAFDPNSTLVLELHYVPYQGEGVAQRNYELLHSEDNALITTNGTGAAPIVGLQDVYPYNRELPIITTLPSQVSWNDSTLDNTPLATFFDDNFSTMRASNVEDTFLAPLHTNDFIPPVNKDTRKEVQFLTTGSRGFATAIPHLGYAIKPPTPRTVLGQNLQTTIAPIIIYVNNLSGNDSNDGLSVSAPMKTIGAAMAAFPPVLRHPCSLQLIPTGLPYQISQLQSSLVQVSLGDGNIVSTKWYALGNIAFVIQAAGRFVVTAQAGATAPVVIDATGFTGFGDGPTSAFFVDTTRVIFNNLQFQGFTDPAVKGINSDIEFVDCVWQNNIQAGSFEQGCGVVLTECSIKMGAGGTGIVLSGSELTVSQTSLTVSVGTVPGPFFVAERQSNMTLQTHGTSALEEVNISGSTVIAEAEINSSIVCNVDWQSQGSATLAMNSALSRTVSTTPFLGGITADSSSSIVTNV